MACERDSTEANVTRLRTTELSWALPGLRVCTSHHHESRLIDQVDSDRTYPRIFGRPADRSVVFSIRCGRSRQYGEGSSQLARGQECTVIVAGNVAIVHRGWPPVGPTLARGGYDDGRGIETHHKWAHQLDSVRVGEGEPSFRVGSHGARPGYGTDPRDPATRPVHPHHSGNGTH